MQKTIELDPTGAWTNQKESSIANSRYICVNRDSSPIGHQVAHQPAQAMVQFVMLTLQIRRDCWEPRTELFSEM